MSTVALLTLFCWGVCQRTGLLLSLRDRAGQPERGSDGRSRRGARAGQGAGEDAPALALAALAVRSRRCRDDRRRRGARYAPSNIPPQPCLSIPDREGLPVAKIWGWLLGLPQGRMTTGCGRWRRHRGCRLRKGRAGEGRGPQPAMLLCCLRCCRKNRETYSVHKPQRSKLRSR